MGNLRDELARLFGKSDRKPGHKPQQSGHGPKAQSTPTEPVPKADWKVGAAPLARTRHQSLASPSQPDNGNSTKGALKPPSGGPAGKAVPTGRSDTAPTRHGIPGANAERTRQIAMAVPSPRADAAGTKPAGPKAAVPTPQFGALRPPPLSRDQEFKRPDAWVSAGAALQPPTGGDGRILSVRIGIDFGTAYTKLAIRAADRVFFVPWDGVRNNGDRYFLPGEVAAGCDGMMWLGRPARAEVVRSDLKLPAKMHASCEQQAAAVAFLAWAMRYARAWLYWAHEPLLRNRTLAWEVNLGCPTNSWSAAGIRSTYKEIGMRAWKLSQTIDGFTWDNALASMSSTRSAHAECGLDGLNLMPEFIAQIAGYVRSPQRRNGLHLLMDAGAGTVDVATFNVAYDEKKEEDRYPIFASEVLPLGTHFLMESRLRRLGATRAAWDDLQVVPDPEEIARQLGVNVAQVRMLDEEFIARLSAAVERILNYTHTKRYGKAPEWRDGLPAFLSGGGSDCDIYRRGLASAFARHGVTLKRATFPIPQEAETAVAERFHRLSVAHGLTQDAESIGRILSPHEIEHAPRFDPLVDTLRERPDRDELYPK